MKFGARNILNWIPYTCINLVHEEKPKLVPSISSNQVTRHIPYHKFEYSEHKSSFVTFAFCCWERP